MFKKFTILPLALLCMQGATAQHAAKNPRNALAHLKPITGAKTTAVESRLIAVSSYYGSNLEFGDTARAWYTGNNGFAPELSEYFPWKADSVLMWEYDPSIPGLLPAAMLQTDINASKQVTAQYFLSWDDNSNSWVHEEEIKYTYTPSGQVASLMSAYESGPGWDSSKTIYTYNSNNKLTQEVYQEWDGSAWVDEYRTNYTYNGNGDIATILEEAFNGTGWDDNYRTTNTYTGNKLMSSLSESYNGSSWENSRLATMIYNSAGQMTDSLVQMWMSTWEDDSKYIYTYNTAGDRATTVIQMAWSGTLENLERTTTGYNNFHQPISERLEMWDDNASQFSLDGGGDTYYYYEQFTNGVKDLPASANGKMHTYPVPARDYINLELDWKTAAAASIALCDMNGRVVKNWNTPSSKTYKTQLDLAGVPAGNYILKVAAGADRLVQQVSIVK